jgi:hypothetical protein
MTFLGVGARTTEEESAATRGEHVGKLGRCSQSRDRKRAEVSSGGAGVPTGTLTSSAIPAPENHSDGGLVSLASDLHPHTEFSVGASVVGMLVPRHIARSNRDSQALSMRGSQQSGHQQMPKCPTELIAFCFSPSRKQTEQVPRCREADQ